MRKAPEAEFERTAKPERRIPRKIKVAAGLLALGSVGGVYGNWHIALGLVQGAFSNEEELAIPDIDGCRTAVESTDTVAPHISQLPVTTSTQPSEAPSVTFDEQPSASTDPIPVVTFPLVPEVTTTTVAQLDTEAFSSHESSAYENDWEDAKDFIQLPFQAARYFEDKVASYESSASGQVYDFYVFGKSDEYEPVFHFESIEAIEQAAYSNIDIFDEEFRESAACMKQVLFEDKRLSGKRVPVVVPAGPAYLHNTLIKFGRAEKGKAGFAMPRLTGVLSEMLPEQYSAYLVITTGPFSEPEGPRISNSLVAHELAHYQFMMVEGDDYTLHVHPEENTAKLLQAAAARSEGFYRIEPLVTYRLKADK